MKSFSKAPIFVGLSGTILVSPDRLLERVQTDVKVALAAAFSFAARELGQSIYLSEILEVIHRVPGVVGAGGVALGKVEANDQGEISLELLPDGNLIAARPVNGVALDQAQAAELLIMDEFSFSQLEFLIQTP
ncbi:MAG: hypothetical protein EPO07_00320 [Verrucomicrobia bacterium]|nr:MAG: hypothetical protein EPO07_00320 [Verrucomicrobiota bacterium]